MHNSILVLILLVIWMEMRNSVFTLASKSIHISERSPGSAGMSLTPPHSATLVISDGVISTADNEPTATFTTFAPMKQVQQVKTMCPPHYSCQSFIFISTDRPSHCLSSFLLCFVLLTYNYSLGLRRFTCNGVCLFFHCGIVTFT